MYLKESSCLGFKPRFKKVFKSSWLKSSSFSQSPPGTFAYPSSSLPLGHSFADQTLPHPKTSTRHPAKRVQGLTSLPSHHPTLPVQPEWGKPVLKEESPILHLGAKHEVLPRGFGCPRAKIGDSNASLDPKPTAARQTSPSTPKSCLYGAGEHQGQGKVAEPGSGRPGAMRVNQRQLLSRFLCATWVFPCTGNWVLITKLNKPCSGSPATRTRQSYSTSNCRF